MKKLLIIGAGGHAKVVIETALSSSEYNDFILLDDNYRKANSYSLFMNKWPIIGTSNDFLKVKESFCIERAFVAIGNNSKRLDLIKKLKEHSFYIPKLIHNSAIVSNSASISEGCAIFANAVIQSEVIIKSGVIINTAASIDHECFISDCVHIAPGVNIAGNVSIGKRSLVGIGASVIQGISIGSDVKVGGGSIVISNLNNGVTAAGVPATLIKNQEK